MSFAAQLQACSIQKKQLTVQPIFSCEKPHALVTNPYEESNLACLDDESDVRNQLSALASDDITSDSGYAPDGSIVSQHPF